MPCPPDHPSRVALEARRAAGSATSPWRARRRAAPRPTRPTRCAPKPPHFAAEGQAGHLPVHAGRGQPRRFVRLQAAARAGRRQDAGLRRRPRHRQHRHARLVAAGHEAALEVRPARQVAAGGRPTCSRRSTGTSTTSASSTRCTPRAWRTARRRCSCTAARRTSSGRRWARGSCTAWAPRTQNLPGFVSIAPSAGQRRGRATTATPSCPPVYQGTALGRAGGPAARGDHPQPGQPACSPTAQQAPVRPAPRAATPSSSSSDPATPSWRRSLNSYELAWRMQQQRPGRARPVEGVGRDAQALRHRRARRPTTSAGSA